MKSFFICAAISILSACSALPSKNYIYLKENESNAYKTLSEAMKIESSINVTSKEESINFSKSTPVIKTSNGLSTFHKISFEKNDSTGKFLIFSAKNHVVGYLKNGFIVPEIEFFDKDGGRLKSVLVQFGEDASCQIGRCLITTYDIGKFPSGKITGIVMAKSDTPDQPFLSKKESLNQFAGGVFINQSFAINIYADFFGNAEIYLANNKPLSADIDGHAIFYQK
jgi:hypothetical protein